MSRLLYLLMLILFSASCKNAEESEKSLTLSDEFKSYWYSGEAEITSYELEQARYGELRNGNAVLIYVTEDFLPDAQVKADSPDANSISILKLNATKNFLTGIYPYSIMQSTFYPLDEHEHALKVSASIQEWCGQVYMQLNNRRKYEIKIHSYFQGEADQELNIEKVPLENEIWNMLRIDPNDLPVGEIEMLPSFEYLRLSHKEVRTYKATGEFYTVEDLNIYRLQYPELNRELKIYFSRSFPFTIEKWEESYPSGFGKNEKMLTTKAVKKQRIKSDYWSKNSNKNLPLREQLELN